MTCPRMTNRADTGSAVGNISKRKSALRLEEFHGGGYHLAAGVIIGQGVLDIFCKHYRVAAAFYILLKDITLHIDRLLSRGVGGCNLIKYRVNLVRHNVIAGIIDH